MPEAGSLIVLRGLGVLVGLILLVAAFRRFRVRAISRGETVLRWVVGVSLIVVSIYPNSINGLASLMAMETHMWGRLIALLVLSNLGLWLLLFRERSKLASLMINFDRMVRSTALHGNQQWGIEKLREAQILVGMPALNEADNLPTVLGRMPESIQGRRVGVLVIDDASTDGTADVVRAHGHAVVSNPFRRGQGAALRLAYDTAQSVGAEVVVTMDSDGQHLPEDIEKVVAPILAGESDFVIGSRILGQGEGGSAFRSFGIRVINTLINTLANTDISDCSSGFKAIRVAKLPDIVLREDQFQAAEAIISAAHNGCRMGEAPITVLPRHSGESKKGHDLSYGLNFTRTVFKTWWR